MCVKLRNDFSAKFEAVYKLIATHKLANIDEVLIVVWDLSINVMPVFHLALFTVTVKY